MRRLLGLVILLALPGLLVACGDDDNDEAGTGKTIRVVTEDNDGSTVTIKVGDEIAPQLPSAEGDPEWVMTEAPDPVVLTGGDSFRFVPSEGTRASYTEFSFVAVGTGTTSLTIEKGPSDDPVATFSVTVEVISRDGAGS